MDFNFTTIDGVLSIARDWSLILLAGLALLLTVGTSYHALVYKRDSRAALGWFGVILLSPVIGALFYLFFGINRIERKGIRLNLQRTKIGEKELLDPTELPFEEMQWVEALKKDYSGFWEIGEKLELAKGYLPIQMRPLFTGDEAYPEMLKAIHNAKTQIYLQSYIFLKDPVGLEFIDELERAKNRGVEVRVLLDDVGSGPSFLGAFRELRKRGIPIASFLPIFQINRSRFSNLRNHRKLLIVDGRVAFTGGLNIAQVYWPSRSKGEFIPDLHFKIQGPLVQDLERVFISDWEFSTDELLAGSKSETAIEWDIEKREGIDGVARVIPDGPGELIERIKWSFISAIQSAKKSIRIQTPYFLPESGIVAALCAASLRGIRVEILIPERSDHPYLGWATMGSLSDLLQYGCHLYLIPRPFEHTKIFIMDEVWMSFGSSNWDQRSLRLNFELNVEIFSEKRVQEIIEYFEKKKKESIPYTVEKYWERNSLEKLRDGFFRIFSPYF